MDWTTENNYRVAVVKVCEKINKNGWGEVHAGNISVKIDSNIILCTPHGINLGEVSVSDLIKVDIKGKKLEGVLEPTSELKMHLTVYKNRSDIRSVIHSHPPYSTAFAITSLDFSEVILP